MKISVFGLGYVGAVSCACFARENHEVIGVDVNKLKVDIMNEGRSPIVEELLPEFIAEGVKSGKLTATTDLKHAVLNSDLSLVCVGTPSRYNGSLNLDYVYRVCQQIGELLKFKDTHHTIAIRSTVLPGTVEKCMAIIAESSGKEAGVGYGMASNPEFLREGTAIKDFFNPPYTVIGATDEISSERLEKVYSGLDAPFYSLQVKESEMIKYANNAFHALKITFANEIGNVCKELNLDGYTIMDIVCQDKKLNLSSYYMKPGFAFGGSCLPKDVRALKYKSRELDIETPVLSNILESNRYQIQRGLRLIYKTGSKKVGILGISFKAGTDDLRESPIVELIETLIGKGYDLKLYDSNVSLAKLMGANKEFIERTIPHISNLLVDSIEEVMQHAEVVVVGNKSPEFAEAITKSGATQTVVDLVRIDENKISDDQYVGICW